MMVAVQHALDVRLAAPQPDVDAAAAVAGDHADLVGAAQRDQTHGADDVRCDVAFELTRRVPGR